MKVNDYILTETYTAYPYVSESSFIENLERKLLLFRFIKFQQCWWLWKLSILMLFLNMFVQKVPLVLTFCVVYYFSECTILVTNFFPVANTITFPNMSTQKTNLFCIFPVTN